MDDKAKIYKIPKFIFARAELGPKGITANVNKLKINVIIGAIINKFKEANEGKIVSFDINLTASAKGCNNPINPTLLGPIRRCIAARTLRSMRVKNATASNKGIKTRRHCIII